MSRPSIVTFCVLALALSPAPGFGQTPPDDWTMPRLDLTVHANPSEESLTVQGRLEVLCHRPAETLELILLGSDANIRIGSVRGEAVSAVRLNEPLPDEADVLVTHVDLDHRVEPGRTLVLEYEIQASGKGFQFRVDSDLVAASWTDSWYPMLALPGDRSQSARMSVAGTTTLHLPAEWFGAAEGRLVSRTIENTEAVEVWELETPLARSFAAGPYTVGKHRFGEREFGVYLLDSNEARAQSQAEILAGAIDAMETAFGPFPYQGYSIIEMPDDRFDWGAASQQGLIFAASNAFGDEGNLPLFAHEAGHAWWGNLVGTDGPGGILCSESLAQYGAVIALETLKGPDAVTEFLRFSAPRYSRYQCAKGFFDIVDMGEDRPLSTLEGGGWEHQLADAKGHWVFHMLRERIGDALFFDTLRGLVDTYGGRTLTLDDLRAAFEAAAPDARLRTFFEQWLDRTGAPRLELDYEIVPAESGWMAQGTVRQVQQGAPYHLFLELGADADPDQPLFTLEVNGASTAFSVAVPTDTTQLVPDPKHKLLIWKPDYE